MTNVPARILGGLIASGTAITAGALVHAHAYTVRRRTALIPARGASLSQPAQLRILHISDTHLVPYQRKRRSFIRSLADLGPDFVVATGDLIADDSAIDPLLDDLGPLLSVPGAFVFGSNDYSGPTLKNPLRYLLGPSSKTANADEDDSPDGAPHSGKPLATEVLRDGLTSGGWVDLNNARTRISVNAWTLDLVGIDDPHIQRHAMPAPDNNETVAGPHMRIALAHAPYTWVLDMMAADHADLTFAGHTHGGQVNLPGSRALVTNCDLPTAFANGLFRWPPHNDNTDRARVLKKNGTLDAAEHMLVNISAGIGTSPYTPIRTFCAPEAIMLDVVQL